MDRAIHLDSISKRLGHKTVLDGIDLVVPHGALVGLIGLNGAGKTTTLRIALGLLAPDAGRARVLGEPSGRIARLAGRIGASLHGSGLDDSLTALQNLRLHALQHGRGDANPDRLLDRLELRPFARQRVARLSQGERQRLSLARALLLRPEVLVLDEPLTHLDPGAVERVLDLLREEVEERGVSILLSSHHLEHVERAAHKFVLIHDGKVLLAGTMDELLHLEESILLVGVRPEAVASAARVLEAQDEVSSVTQPTASGEPLRVQIRTPCAGKVNALLQGAGVQVHLLAPERLSLHVLFRDAVRRAGQQEKSR